MSDLGSIYADILGVIKQRGFGDDRHVYSGALSAVWETPFQNTFLSNRFSSTPMRDLARALWIYAGCRNLREMKNLSGNGRIVANPRYGAEKNTHDYAETVIGMTPSFNDGDTYTIYATGDAKSQFASLQTCLHDYPCFTLSYAKQQESIIGTASFQGGDLRVIFQSVLPAIALLNWRVLTGEGAKFFRLIFDNAHLDMKRFKSDLYLSQQPDKYQSAEPTWLADLKTTDLFSAFDDAYGIGGSRMVRRVLKPIILGGRAEAENMSDTNGFVEQLEDCPMKTQLLDFYDYSKTAAD